MKKEFLIIVLAVSFFGCNSHKNTNVHTHDGEAYHTHDDEVSNKVSNYFEAYSLKDESYGTKTEVTISGNERIMITNSLPNHETGAFPNQGNPNTISAQNITYTFPLNPKYTGNAQWMREPGVALNGVKFEPGTAEVVECETGENYRVEAIQNVIDLGLDFNHAHVQPTGAYHYHGSPTSIISKFDTGEDLVHIGFAHDGFPMYYSKSGKYKPSYKLLNGNRDGEDCTYTARKTIDISVGGHHDGTYGSDYEYVDSSGDLDECNGTTIDGKYIYLVTEEFPYISRCVMGEVSQQEQQGPPRGEQQGNGQGERPNTAELIKQMDANKDGKLSKTEAKGPLKQDFSKIDTNSDGFISKEELEKGANGNGKRPQGGRAQR
ncbi:YHYH protein [uncultured Lacinutrix sp.]|uniref:YHYH protein n=1 Tax=uncultured Lacinutrix sp. TaxID=574032 RepID=UPI00260EEFD0|nr:YHYH protein [uncultured Lacinutrix sp.]